MQADWGPGRRRHLQFGQGDLRRAVRAAVAGGTCRRVGLPGDLEPGQETGHATALGRQQQPRRGTQPVGRLRHRRHAEADRPRRHRPHRGLDRHRHAARIRQVFPHRPRARRARCARSTRKAAPPATARAAATSAANTSARSRRSPPSAPTAAASIPTPCNLRRTRACCTRPTRIAASAISARPGATPTRRSTASGCARPTCTTARCRRCGTCCSPPRNAPRPSIAATTCTTRGISASSPISPPPDGKRLFAYDTTLPGNGNAGHEGAAYGTTLPDADKWALLEYLKTF